MDKKKLIAKIVGRKELVDYSYAILFLLISSFFLIFAIKPALSIAFSLKRESIDLKRVNDIYEKNILKLVDIQTNMEQIRNKIDLLEIAVPQNPHVRTLISDLQQIAAEQGASIKNFEISELDLKKKSDKSLKTIVITMEMSADFQSTNQLIRDLIMQRRLKTIKTMQIVRDEKNSTESAQLKVIFETEGYYL